jgi:hypothetical protein
MGDAVRLALKYPYLRRSTFREAGHCARNTTEAAVLTVTRDLILPTTITGSYPRPLWFDRNLAGRSFKSALGDSVFREQYIDAVASIIAEQETAGLDIVSDGDSRFDLTVGGKSWFFYPIERLGASAATATPRGAGCHDMVCAPGRYCGRAICAPALAPMLWNEFYDDDKAMIFDLCDIMNAELRDMVAPAAH